MSTLLRTTIVEARLFLREPMAVTFGVLFPTVVVLATGGTLAAAIRFVADRGAGQITAVCLLAAPEGVAYLEQETAELKAPVTIVTAALDERLNDKGYIVPGLGDAGDRLYGVVG